jgi:hypothetical protein
MTAGHCNDCKHWGPFDLNDQYARDSGTRRCGRIVELPIAVVTVDTTAYVASYEGDADLYTRASFGCTLFEPIDGPDAG